MTSYFRHKQSMKESTGVYQLKGTFLLRKKVFKNAAAYGGYTSDYHEKKRALRKAKGQLGLNEHIVAFRYSETQLQSLLGQTAQVPAEEVSNEIKINTGSSFFEARKHFKCGGNCHAS